jgi:hypothetical protein
MKFVDAVVALATIAVNQRATQAAQAEQLAELKRQVLELQARLGEPAGEPDLPADVAAALQAAAGAVVLPPAGDPSEAGTVAVPGIV